MIKFCIPLFYAIFNCKTIKTNLSKVEIKKKILSVKFGKTMKRSSNFKKMLSRDYKYFFPSRSLTNICVELFCSKNFQTRARNENLWNT